ISNSIISLLSTWYTGLWFYVLQHKFLQPFSFSRKKVKINSFYKYYRTSNSFIDEKLFVREKHDLKLSLDTVYFETDHRFSTSHDYKVAKIIANDQIQVYVEDQLSSKKKVKKNDSYSLNWTGSKTALTELIYALYLQGIFDNGNADIKNIAKTFESVFNINLGDFYHTF